MGVATVASGTCSLVWGKIMAEDSLGLITLHRGSFFDDRMSINLSAVFENQSCVLRFIWIALSSIGPKLIKAALD